MATTSPPKRRPAVRKKPQPVLQSTVTGDFEPLHFDSPTEAPEVERVVIAYLDDYELTMPAEVPPHVGLKIMRTARKLGDQAAMLEMLEEVLGEDGYDRLANWQSLKPENLADLFKVVQSVAMGAMEVPKASSRNA